MPEIAQAIELAKAERAERTRIAADRVLQELAKIGFANMADYMRASADGDPYLDFSEPSRDQAAALVEVTVEDFKDGRGENARDVRRVKFRLADKRAALVDIGKHFGMFVDKVEMKLQKHSATELADEELMIIARGGDSGSGRRRGALKLRALAEEITGTG